MYRSFKDIQADLAASFKTQDKQKYLRVNEEHQTFLDFWCEVDALSASNDKRGVVARMNDYFETASITKEEAEFLSSYFRKLSAEAKQSADADELIRMMQDFFRLQRGTVADRQVVLANSGPVSPRFIYEQPIEVDKDVWLDSDETPWLNALLESLQGFHPLQMFFSVRFQNEGLSNLIKTLEHGMSSLELSVSEGMYLSIMLPIEFNRMRDNWMLPKQQQDELGLAAG